MTGRPSSTTTSSCSCCQPCCWASHLVTPSSTELAQRMLLVHLALHKRQSRQQSPAWVLSEAAAAAHAAHSELLDDISSLPLKTGCILQIYLSVLCLEKDDSKKQGKWHCWVHDSTKTLCRCDGQQGAANMAHHDAPVAVADLADGEDVCESLQGSRQ